MILLANFFARNVCFSIFFARNIYFLIFFCVAANYQVLMSCILLGLVVGPTTRPCWEPDPRYPVAESEPEILARWPESSPSTPLEQNIASLLFPSKSVPILRMSRLHGQYRFWHREERRVSRDENFFALVIHREALGDRRRQKHELVYCYCLRAKEWVDGTAVPVVYCVVSEESRFDEFFAYLHAMRESRKFSAQSGGPWTFPRQTRGLGAPSFWYEAVWLCLFLVQWTRASEQILAGLLADQKIIVFSKSLAKRATAVLALLALLPVKYCHPVLPCPPFQLMRELPHAPTPLMAGSSVLPKSVPPNCLVLDLDAGVLLGQPVQPPALEIEDTFPLSESFLVFLQTQLDVMNLPDLTVETALPLLREVWRIKASAAAQLRGENVQKGQLFQVGGLSYEELAAPI